MPDDLPEGLSPLDFEYWIKPEGERLEDPWYPAPGDPGWPPWEICPHEQPLTTCPYCHLGYPDPEA